MTVQPWRIKRHKNLFCSLKCHANFRQKKSTLICSICEKSFQVPTLRLSKAKIISCSRKCSFEARRRLCSITRQCKYCGNDFSFCKSRAKYFKKIFCSLKCSNKSQSSGRKDSQFIHGKGRYRKIAFQNLPNICSFCKKTKKHMDIHHIDHNRSNNEISNLTILCRSCHLKYHKLSTAHPS